MMPEIPQKHVMQLFGNWGYSVPEMKKEIIKNFREAQQHSDRIGAIAYSNIYALCAYAEHADNKRAILDMFDFILPDDKETAQDIKSLGVEKFLRHMARAMTGEKLPKGFTENDCCNSILFAVYKIALSQNTFKDTVIYQRQHIMNSLANDALNSIMSVADDISDDIFQTMTEYALAIYEKSNHMPVEYEINRTSIRAFDELTKRLVSFKDTILDIPSLIHADFEALSQHLMALIYAADMPQQFERLNMSIGDADKIMPHVIYKFKMAYFYVLSAFLIGVSAGIFDYSNYAYLMEAKDIKDKYINDIQVSQIIRHRSN